LIRRKDNGVRRNLTRPRMLWRKGNGRWKLSDRLKWRYFKKSDARQKSGSTTNTSRRKRSDWSWSERSSVIGRSACRLQVALLQVAHQASQSQLQQKIQQKQEESARRQE
jgi:hypothetical protein